MHKPTQPDVRHDQLALLKFERRGLRPMALKLIDKAASKRTKLAAIGAVAAMALALADAPASYAAKIGVAPDLASRSASVIAEVCQTCDRIAALVSIDAADSIIRSELEGLFLKVDGEHARLEKFALTAQAVLLKVGDTLQAMGTGGKGEPPNSAWLTRV